MTPEQVQLYADLDAFAQRHYNKDHADDPLGSVVGMESQVVAGMVYKLKYVTKSGKEVTISIYRDLNG
jgi:hypothetical protein